MQRNSAFEYTVLLNIVGKAWTETINENTICNFFSVFSCLVRCCMFENVGYLSIKPFHPNYLITLVDASYILLDIQLMFKISKHILQAYNSGCFKAISDRNRSE